MGVAHAQIRRPGRLRASKRLLALAGEERLVDEVRHGNEAAFEVIYERHSAQLLSFCRHMLGSRESGEEAVQHTFASAWADLQRSDRPIQLKPWLYRIARNRCISLLRARRLETTELDDPPATEGLADEVARRADLRALLADLRDLPEEQRAALLLSELGGLSHADVAEAIGRREDEVKALVFRARSTLADWRSARETPCGEIREQLATLRGGALRRRPIQRHLKACAGCRAFREEVRVQRRMMSVVLPVIPTIGLREGVLAAIGVGGATSAGAGGLAVGTLGTATIAKVAAVAVAVGGAAGGGKALLDGDDVRSPAGAPAVAPASAPGSGPSAPGALESGLSPGSKATGRAKAGTRDRAKARRRGRRGGRSRGASGLAPPDTPVRARGEPPALGRLKQGKPPPPGRGGATRGHGLAKGQSKAATPKVKEPKPERTKAPRTKTQPGQPLLPGLKPDKSG